MESHKGRVIRSVGDYHTVATIDGRQVLCRARGRLKQRGAVVTGDLVTVSIDPGSDEGVIEDVTPRRTYLYRPTIANVDTSVVVMALARPSPSWELVDRLLALAEREGLSALVVFNKVDLVDPTEAEAARAPYVAAGYPVYRVSAATGEGIDKLKAALEGRVSILAGPSGVGKSSLLNALLPEAGLKTGEVSHKLSRGRHTTRHVSLLPIGQEGWVADSPGFSTLSFGTMDPREFPLLYPEFVRLREGCRFSGCMHRSEPDCAVKEAVEDGRLDEGRYQRYLRILQEIEEAFERRYG